MIEVNVLNTSGKKVGVLNLKEEIFGREYNEPLIHQVVVAQLANARQGTKSALTRTEVRGGGRKPYRQKGTGNARQGSIRAPQYIKGGVVFAPKPRDFSKKVNKVMKRNALLSALSEKIRQDEFVVCNKFDVKDGKTKEVATILNAMKLGENVLIVTAADDELVLRATANLPRVEVTNVSLLNVYDVVKFTKCLITKEAIQKIEEVNE